MSSPSSYGSLETKWRHYWQAHKLFSSSPAAAKKPYTIIMPPPNVTGILHMGHVLNNTLQDIVARRERMRGREVCWVPGTDHASIATEAKVVKQLQEQGLTKEELGREGFLKRAWGWKETYEKRIVDQLRRLGLSCDWDRLYFTLDPKMSAEVIASFVQLYEAGYVYRDTRMIHWDPQGMTALSDEEVVYKEVSGQLYFLRYKLVDGGFVTVATTRPETIFGDTALCVHPSDTRYTDLHGAKAYVPFVQRPIPIITDPYVTPEFGTGCLKVTPAHDMNDYVLGKRHGLPMVEVIKADGTLGQEAGAYSGLDRALARRKVIEDLEKLGQVEKVVSYRHQVGFSERTGAVVEPRCSTQWFVKMEALAKPALRAVQEGAITFHPKKFTNLYTRWLEHTKDWCISRQLWWGHRIPVYYLKDGRWVVGRNKEEALAKARGLPGAGEVGLDDLSQDPDVLDTWFSAWLCPLSVFGGITQPENEELASYYPTELLVTAPEIIFFWVARMVMAGYYFHHKPPFRHVYFTGIVRDKEGRKMSKSLGNSPDPLVLIDRYGADGVRAGMLFCAPAGNDLLFDEALCQQGAQFAYKVQNALRLFQCWTPSAVASNERERHAVAWFKACYHDRFVKVERCFQQFRLSEALHLVYKLIWDDFCAHYLEMVKPDKGGALSREAYEATRVFFEALLKLLHPFMPFITEEVWHALSSNNADRGSIAMAPWPVAEAADTSFLEAAEHAFQLLALLRQHRTDHALSSREAITLYTEGVLPVWWTLFEAYLSRAAGLQGIIPCRPASHTAYRFLVGATTFWLPAAGVGGGQHIDKWRSELAYQEGFLRSVERKLANPAFCAQAPQAVVAREKKKQEDALRRIATIKGWLEGAV